MRIQTIAEILQKVPNKSFAGVCTISVAGVRLGSVFSENFRTLNRTRAQSGQVQCRFRTGSNVNEPVKFSKMLVGSGNFGRALTVCRVHALQLDPTGTRSSPV
jgi:hypothetical protein